MGKRKTQKEWEEQVYEKVGNEYTFIDSYKGFETAINVKHNTCGNIYKTSPRNFLKSKGCKNCNYGKIYSHKTKTNEDFIQEVKDLVNTEYVFLEDYVNTNTPIKVQHKACGSTYTVAPRDFLKGSRCRKCFYKSKSKSEEDWTRQYKSLPQGNDYKFLEHYKGDGTLIEVLHMVCNHTYKVKPNNFINGSRCPNCHRTKSQGEDLIERYLVNHKIDFVNQQKFDDLRSVYQLSYDFYLPNHKGKNILIEYQGEQHFQPVEYFGGHDKFLKQQKHDTLKRNYAKENDYLLIEVPYTTKTATQINKYLDSLL